MKTYSKQLSKLKNHRTESVDGLKFAPFYADQFARIFFTINAVFVVKYTSSFILEEEEKIMNDVTHTKSKRKISDVSKGRMWEEVQKVCHILEKRH